MNNLSEETVTKPWTEFHPKVVAAAIVGGLVYVLQAVGVDIASVLQDVENSVGIDLPNTQALLVGAAAVLAGYLKKGVASF